MHCVHCGDNLPEVTEDCPLCGDCLANSGLIVIEQCSTIERLRSEIEDLYKEIEDLNASEYQ